MYKKFKYTTIFNIFLIISKNVKAMAEDQSVCRVSKLVASFVSIFFCPWILREQQGER